jgi:hypothetical protein
LTEPYRPGQRTSPTASSEEAQNNQEHNRPDRRGDDQVDEMGEAKVDAQLGKQPVADKGADNTYAKIGDETKARTAHDLAREPARKNADKDNDDKTFTGQGDVLSQVRSFALGESEIRSARLMLTWLALASQISLATVLWHCLHALVVHAHQ